MISVSIAVFIMMSVAASLGFAIAWVYRSKQLDQFSNQLKQNDLLAKQLKEEQESLVKHANNLQSGTLKITEKNEKQAKRIQSLKDMVRQLKADKDFIISEYKQFQEEVENKLAQQQKLNLALEDLREKNLRFKIKADKWKTRVHDLQSKLKDTESDYTALKKTHHQLRENKSTSPAEPDAILVWENKYKELKLRYLALTKEKQTLEDDLESKLLTASKPIDETLNKLSQEIVLLKKENAELKKGVDSQLSTTPSIIDPKEESLKRIKHRSEQVNWERIGRASVKEADDLKILKGLGRTIEEKLHQLGIFTFDQLSNLSPYDQQLFNYFLELPKGKIQAQRWVEQAQELVSQVNLSPEEFQQIQQNLEKLNLTNKGEASPSQKDNLQSIIGIGPYIEQKLNAIGIFRFEQLSMLSDADIKEINNIMKLAPGHIQKDDWVGQAKRMK